MVLQTFNDMKLLAPLRLPNVTDQSTWGKGEDERLLDGAKIMETKCLPTGPQSRGP